LPAPIEIVFNRPSHHRVHHGANEVYLDRNYGGILIIWDRIFGTYQGRPSGSATG
jgi:sterol desaturase/sphingolipid hydroxylase (fatty acid hydroxylase superfamily)